MQPFHSILVAGFALFVTGCASPWPNLPSREYTGVVINAALNTPEAGATVSATRPGYRGRIVTEMIKPDFLGSTTTDTNGHFLLHTTTGYATRLYVSSADHRLYGEIRVAPDETSNLRLSIEASLSHRVCRSPLVDLGRDANTVKVTDAGIHSIIAYISAHPHEHPSSLKGYSSRGVISPETLAIFTNHPDFFFGTEPGVEYHWGHEVLLIPDAQSPITFRPESPNKHLMR